MVGRLHGQKTEGELVPEVPPDGLGKEYVLYRSLFERVHEDPRVGFGHLCQLAVYYSATLVNCTEHFLLFLYAYRSRHT